MRTASARSGLRHSFMRVVPPNEDSDLDDVVELGRDAEEPAGCKVSRVSQGGLR